MTTNASAAQAPGAAPRHRVAPMPVSTFILLGCLQTIAAYFAFQRADDHAYFLDIANHGLAAVPELGNDSYDLKAKIAGFVFHVMTAPSRWLGGAELTHLLWLRVLSLAGFVCAHRWVCRVVASGRIGQSVRDSQTTFFLLCLLYPAQLAWTASLLRDGLGCAGLFAGLLAFSHGRWLTAAVAGSVALALRPEFALVVALLAAVVPMTRFVGRIHRRRLLLLAVIAAVSVVSFGPRNAASEFAIYAFGDEGVAYPSINGVADLHGYLLVLLQMMLDPISIGSISGGIFPVAEVAFFGWITLTALRRLNDAPARVAALMIALLTATWLFGYFEIYVSGFSRHRLALVVLLIALVAVLRHPQALRTRSLKSAPRPAAKARPIPLPAPPVEHEPLH